MYYFPYFVFKIGEVKRSVWFEEAENLVMWGNTSWRCLYTYFNVWTDGPYKLD